MEKRLLKLVPKDKLVCVYHPSIPNVYTEWENWAKEGYVLGIGSFPTKEVHNILFSKALKYKSKVHGFAMTRNDFVKEYPWFSVDSSSWNTGQRFGSLHYFDSKLLAIKQFRLKNLELNMDSFNRFRQVIYPKISSYLGVSIGEIISNRQNSYFLDVCNVYAYLKQEDALTELWKTRGIIFN